LRPMIDQDKDVSAVLIGHGTASSAGAISGRAVFSVDEAISCSNPCILIVKDLNMDGRFAEGMAAASGI
jgi:hypothetical protein